MQKIIAGADVEFLLEANKFADSQEVCRTIAQIVGQMLRHAIGDALFFFPQSDRPLLYHHNGNVLLDDEPENFWLYYQGTLDAMGVPYSFTSLPQW